MIPKAQCRLVLRLVVAWFLFPVMSGGGISAAPNQVKTAKSKGNNQATFSMTLDPATCPFCNTTEIFGGPADRQSEALYLPALIGPTTCQSTAVSWELAADPFQHDPFLQRDGSWSASTGSAWKQVASGLYVKTFTVETTLKEDVKQSGVSATLSLPSSEIGSKVSAGSLAVVDLGSDYAELVSIVSVAGQTITIKGSGNNSGWKYDHVAGVTFKLLDKSSECVAGKADLLLQRSFRYGFCDRSRYNVSDQLKTINPKFETTDADYYIVNIVVWDRDKTTYSASSSRWYVYNRGDHGKWYRQKLPFFDGSLRIYGSKKPIGLVAIHIRPAASDSWKEFQKLKISYTVTVKSKTATNVSDFTTALSIISGQSAALEKPQKDDPDGFFGAMFFKAKAAADLVINSQVDFPKGAGDVVPKDSTTEGKTVADLQAGSSDVRFVTWVRGATRTNFSARKKIFPVKTGEGTGQSVNVAMREPIDERNSQQDSGTPTSGSGSKPPTKQAGGTKQNGDQQTTSTEPSSNPSDDCQPTSSNGQQSACKFSATIDDEDLYHWDVSFAVPFRAITELQFNQSTGSGSSVVPKTITRLNAYALFDVYPIAADIKTPPIIAVPHILVGLPISGKVFNKPLFGVADGFNLKKISFLSFLPIQVQFFGGLIYNKEFRQIPGTTGSANVTGHRVWKGTYGIEIPVSQFKGLLTSKKSGSSTTSTTGTAKSNN